MNYRMYYKDGTETLVDHILVGFKASGVDYRRHWNSSVRDIAKADKVSIYNNKIKTEFYDLLILFDFSIIWFDKFLIFSVEALFFKASESKGPKLNLIRTLSMLSARISSDLRAVRRLVILGYDVQARVILRSLSESIDAFCYANIDADFCDNFVSGQDPEENKKNWFKHISKGRARTKCYTHLSGVLNFDHPPNGWEEYRNSEETALSAAVHPSFTSGWLSLFPHGGTEENEPVGNVASVSTSSLRTLTYAVIRSLEAISYELVAYRNIERFCAQIADQKKEKRILFDPVGKYLRCASQMAPYLQVTLIKSVNNRQFESESDLATGQQ